VTIETGQLRRWVDADYACDNGKIFLVLRQDVEHSEIEVCWKLLIDGREDWHFSDVIEKDSEVIDGVS